MKQKPDPGSHRDDVAVGGGPGSQRDDVAGGIGSGSPRDEVAGDSGSLPQSKKAASGITSESGPGKITTKDKAGSPANAIAAEQPPESPAAAIAAGLNPGSPADAIAEGQTPGSPADAVAAEAGRKAARKLSWLEYVLISGLWIAACAISTHDLGPPLRASFSLLRSNDFDRLLNSKAAVLDIRRTIQAHYLSYGVYIPLDDIVLNAQEKQPLRDLLESACKPGRATIWVPLKFHVPLAGEKVFEWCLVKV